MDWKARLRTNLFPSLPIEIPAGISKVAAVVIPVGFHPDTGRDEILMTKRTQLVHTHKGQIGFPGGFWEVADANLLETALREAYEEIGTPADTFEVLGRLTPVTTHLKEILVYPFVAEMKFPFEYQLNPAEVDKVLYIPLSRLIDEGFQPMEVPVESFRVKSIGMTVDNELVWGASAKMLEELRSLLTCTHSRH